jgi:hypothetical protein
MQIQLFQNVHETATHIVSIFIIQTWLNSISHAYHSPISYSLTPYTHAPIEESIQSQSFTVHKHGSTQYHMHSTASTHIHLHTILIHQLDNPCNVNHSSMHIKQPQIQLASTMNKHGFIHYLMYSSVSTHIHLRTILMQCQSFKYTHQTATNTVSIYNEQTWHHILFDAFLSINSYSLTHYTHSSIGQPMQIESFNHAHQTAKNTFSIYKAKAWLHTILYPFNNLISYSLTDYTQLSIGQPMHNQSFKYTHQTATNTVSICIAQTWLHTISNVFHYLNSYSLTTCTHSSIG